MIPFKITVERTAQQKKTEIKSPYNYGCAVRLWGAYYNSTNPNEYVALMDSDGDQFVYNINGQGEPQGEPKPIMFDIPITVRLPLYYYDSGEGNKLILWGEVEKIDKLETTF